MKHLSNSGASWWHRGYETVLNRLVAALEWRLGLDKIHARLKSVETRADSVAPMATTWAVSNWIQHARLDESPLVSVILATRNRSGLLRRAVASVVAQEYRHWEIIIIDDDSTDDTPETIGSLKTNLGDEKIRTLRIPRGGVCAARNHGLALARGEFVAYLDDDNAMHPLWLKAVVWAFLQRADVDVVYGGIMVDDYSRLHRRGSGELPSYHLNPFDAQALRSFNLADIGAIAHRHQISDARFDESLQGLGDWDLLLRLTREKPPLVLPVIACFYTTTALNRLSENAEFDREVCLIRERNRHES